MTYGIFQEHYLSHWTFHGNKNTVGVIGMTYNGVMYMSMPLLFWALTRRWARYRRSAAIAGIIVSCLSFLVCSFAKDVWHLVLAQGVLAAIGGALLFTPTTLSQGEHFTANNRSIAYGITLSCKNITGTACPFLMQVMLDNLGFRKTMWVWAGVTAVTSLLAVAFMPMSSSDREHDSVQHPRRVPWDFLRHRTFYIYAVAIMLQSSGYGIPQTYLNGYAHEVASLSINTSTLLITL
jgi:predicted MFS family arabinose efflux permease